LLGFTGIFYAADPTQFDSVTSVIGVPGAPADLLVTEYCNQNVDSVVSGTSATYLSYAPGSSVTISGGGPLYGALVDKTLTVSGNSFVHQDLAMPDIWGVFGP
jgi:hypothetical protein